MSRTALLGALAIALAALPAHAQTLAFPTTSADYSNYYPTSYFDHSGDDWNCGSFTYGGHRGSDYGVGGFPGMDAGQDIAAAASGSVVYVHDGEPDRCTSGSCGGGSGFGNYVKVQHPDGRFTMYAHMSTWSITVDEGDSVECGTILGLVGSSGNSTGPHIHFEVRTPSETAFDPFEGPCSSGSSRWTMQGAYREVPTRDCDGTPPPTCSFGIDAACGETLHGDLGSGGSSDEIIYYSCSDFNYSGPEYAYRFTAAATESVTIDVTGFTQDLDLMILEGDDCDPMECIANSESPDLGDESVTFDAVEGTTYAIVLDGWEDRTSPYDITFGCTPPEPDELPDLSISATIDFIPGQPPDFNPAGDSASIFDVYTGQQVTVRFTFSNATGAATTAQGVVAGLSSELPYLGLARWDLLTDDPAAGCGEDWCPDPTADLPGQPPRDDPGSEIDVILGDIPAGTSKMLVAVADGLMQSPATPHPQVRTWVGHVDGVYEKAGYDSTPTLNEGQTWNDGDLRLAAEMDVWDPDTPIDPSTDAGSDTDAGPWMGQDEGCGCTLVR